MEHGYLILAIMTFLFLSIYGYSYVPIILEKRKENSLKLEEAKLEAERQKNKFLKQEFRDEKLKKSLKRSAEIKMELQLLAEFKNNRTGFFDEELHKMKVEKMKKQQAG